MGIDPALSKAHYGATGGSGGNGAEFGPGVRVKLLPLKARGALDVRCLTFVTEHLVCNVTQRLSTVPATPNSGYMDHVCSG